MPLTPSNDLRLVRVLGALAVAALWLCAPRAVDAAKWRHCPNHVGHYRSDIGYLSAPFIHPGRQIGIFLRPGQVGATGGFSTEPDGNQVVITFASLFGNPATLPPFTVAAVTPATLYFTFPDARAILGRPLAGPVEILVSTANRNTAHILPRHLVALPPPNDVRALVTGTLEQSALATMDTRGSIWIPVQFSAFGPMPKPMPNCPMDLIPLTAFTIALSVRSTPAVVTGTPVSYPPLRALRRVEVFLGDFAIGGVSYYGLRVGDVPVLRTPRGWGIRVCGINDAVDLVLRAPGWQRWAQPWSSFGAWMPSSQPLDVVLGHATADMIVGGVSTGDVDAFGEECVLK